MPSTAWSSAASSNTMFAALPPSSRVSALSLPGEGLVDPLADLGRTGERDLRHVLVGHEVHADLARPRDDVYDARRQVGLAATSANRSAVSGVVEAGLRTTVLPAARAGAIFHASMSSGKFHGMTCAATPSGVAAAGERVLELVRPARVVPEVRGRERHVDVAALLDRLARVHRLEDRELAAPLLHDPRDPEQVLRPLAARQAAPRAAAGTYGGRNRLVDVRRRSPSRPRRAAARWTGRPS